MNIDIHHSKLAFKAAVALVAVAAAVTVGLPAASSQSATVLAGRPPTAQKSVTAPVAPPLVVQAAVAVAQNPVAVYLAPAPAAPPALSAPQTASAPAATTTGNSATDRTAYINAMYASVVPAGQRAAMAGRYTLGYNLPGLSCGTGCSGLFNGQARSSFNNAFFAQSITYQRNTLAHEAAHAYGFLFFHNYATPSWAGLGGWQTQFNSLDRSFARTYDAEAWAACVAWQETGFNNRVDQITNICTQPAATLAMAQIA
jgi:hypothetical protein